MLSLMFLPKRRFLALFPYEYFYFAVIDGQYLTPEHLGLCRAECLNAELSGAWPMVEIQRFKLDTFILSSVQGMTELFGLQSIFKV